ncbi:glycosyltransferase family 2 protein [Microbacterium aurum]
MSEPSHTAGRDAAPARTAFAGHDEHADVAALVVTHNSASHLDALIRSLRREAAGQSIRLVIVDNSSKDDTIAIAQRHADAMTVITGANLGYAGGVNRAMAAAGEADSYLVLNPDLTLQPGCVAALRDRRRRSGAGIVVPAIMDAEGAQTLCLRNEPSLAAALADVALGARRRPSWIPSETVCAPAEYASARQADWATGAAMLIDSAVAEAVGTWDERFFLYSEETDFCRRARERGFTIWYEPAARVHHAAGGSGSSLELEKLLAVNRVRYARKHMSRLRAALFRGLVALNALARGYDRTQRAVLRTVADERSWRQLPAASRLTRQP